MLWGDTPPGLIQLWWLDGRRSQYLRAPAGAGGLDGAVDVYTGVAIAHKDHGRYKRATANQAAGIAGLWCDIDVNGGPDAKTGGAPDKTAAIELARTGVLEPTMIVDSGYGVHAWWLLDQPWRFTSQADQDTAARMSAQWYALHRACAREQGWTVDHTHDLARLLRLPGTVNGKGGHLAPVTVIATGGPRRTRGELEQLAATAGDVQATAGSAQQLELSGLPEIQLRDGAQPPMVKVDALRVNSPEFAMTLDHRRPDGQNWSLSEYDMSIATQAAQANFTDQEIADLISYHRRLHNPNDRKAGRMDYLRRTVAKARDNATRNTALARMRERTGRAA